MNRQNVKTQGLPALIFWTAVWAVGARLLNNPLLLPGPVRVLRCLWNLMGQSSFWQTTAVSLGRILLGVLSAVLRQRRAKAHRARRARRKNNTRALIAYCGITLG